MPITRRRLETRSVGTSHADAERSSTGEGANQQRFRGPSGSVLAGLVQHLGRSRVAGSNSTAATEQCWADVDQAMRDMARTLGTVLPVSERQSSQSQILHERQSSQSQILHERWSSQSQTAQPAGEEPPARVCVFVRSSWYFERLVSLRFVKAAAGNVQCHGQLFSLPPSLILLCACRLSGGIGLGRAHPEHL